jgi:predicted TIM-barrel fold metal-dependent hydrolase
MNFESMISSDSHIIEPPDLWVDRVDKEFAERAPRVEREDTGDWWYIDGKKSMSFLGVQTGDRFEKDPTELIIEARFEQVRHAAYDPALYVDENLTDGIIAQVIYPSEALLVYSIGDSALCSAAMRAYNDYIADFCSYDTGRMKGIALLNVDDPADAVAEMTRCRNMGLAGVMITVLPPADRAYDNPMYDSLWAAAADLQMPISMHVATGRQSLSVDSAQTTVTKVSEAAFYLQDHFVRKSLGEMIFSGVFERHPGLRVGSVEHEVAWLPFFLAQMDYTYTQRPVRGAWHRFADPDTRPSHYFTNNCFVSFQEDSVGVRTRDVFGVNTLMWGSDYPHTESTFPRSREIVGEILADVPEDEQLMIVRDNAARLYDFDVAALTERIGAGAPR